MRRVVAEEESQVAAEAVVAATVAMAAALVESACVARRRPDACCLARSCRQVGILERIRTSKIYSYFCSQLKNKAIVTIKLIPCSLGGIFGRADLGYGLFRLTASNGVPGYTIIA